MLFVKQHGHFPLKVCVHHIVVDEKLCLKRDAFAFLSNATKAT